MESSSTALTPDIFVRNWQHTGARILRAQERMLQGVATAAKLEMRFGQELMERRLALLNWTDTDPKTRTDHAVSEFECVMSLMRDVTEELRSGFTDAARLLAETAEEELDEGQDMARQAGAQMRRNVEKVGDATQQTLNKGARASQDALSRAEDVVSVDK